MKLSVWMIWFCFIGFPLLGFLRVGYSATLEPLGLQDARLLQKNEGEFRIGFSYIHDLHNLFQANDLNRRIAEIPSLSLNFGLGERVEGQVSYSFLYLRQDGNGESWGTGDMTFGFKVRVKRDTSSWPALAVRLGAKLPNADDTQNFGNDASNIFVDFLGTQPFSWVNIHLNLGLAIIGAPPGSGGGQDDLLNYRLGFVVPVFPRTVKFLFSVEGLTFEDSLNERGAVRGGFQYLWNGFIMDIGGSVGYVGKSEDWSIQTGLTIPIIIPAHW